MNTRFLVSAGAVIAIASCFGADLKSDWQKILDNYCSVAKKKDLKKAEAIVRANFDKNFKFIDAKGNSMGLDEWIKQGNDEMKATGTVSAFSIHIDSAKQTGSKAEMMTTITFGAMIKMDPKAKPSEMKYVGKSVMSVAKKGSKWWITKIVEKSSKMTLGGKPFNGG
jgi:hypothetical protein